jgi:Ni,Fe-hydrogenase III large subunit
MTSRARRSRNGKCLHVRELQPEPFGDFRKALLADVAAGARVAAFFGQPIDGSLLLHAVVADGDSGEFGWRTARVGGEYPALTLDCPQLHWFERELAEQWGVRPVGHPWLKPIRFHKSYGEMDAWGRADSDRNPPGVTDYFRVEGEEVHEVAVGPVHAGVIEPGHFRFQCHGELVFHLEISLGYQHRGVERALVGGPGIRTVHYMETLAGDTTVGHTLAYCQAVEGLAGLGPTRAASAIRAIALELERLANHTGDLGALANDVGYLPTSSFCGRLRGDFLNMTALLCGNRFGRRLVRAGGLGVVPGANTLAELGTRLEHAMADVAEAVDLLWRTPSVRARFETAGRVEKETCLELGLVGVAARACGVERDARREFPSGAYCDRPFPVSTHPDGNVQARAWVRWLEIQSSAAFVRELLDVLAKTGAGELQTPTPFRAPMCPDAGVVSVVEGWRGEICHVALTDSQGRFTIYKVVDPSFHNWIGLAMASRNQQISDFPLCNKSFNLSYCGHDL